MNKLKPAKLVFLAFNTALLMVSCSNPGGSTEDALPNILLITSEDNGPQLSCYGDPYVKTPVLDELASEGILFSSAYVTQAGCSQARSSIFTGLYPHQNGQMGLATHNLRMYHDSLPNIFSELKKAGYRTGVIGKIHVNPESSFPLDFHSRIKGGFSNRDVKAIADTAQKWISSEEDPFILMVNYKDAHRPFIKQAHGLPEKPLEATDIEILPEIGIKTEFIMEQLADYYNCMMRLDTGIGMLLETLAEAGKRENTVVIYLGDHGQDIIRGKRTSYEGGTRIPLIMYCPEDILSHSGDTPSKGRVVGEMVSIIDLLPTIQELAGIEQIKDLSGRSLMPFFKGENPEWRKYLFTEYHLHSGHNFYPQRTVRDSRYKLINNLLHGEINPGYQFTIDRFLSLEAFNRELEQSPPHVRDAYGIMKRAPEYELYDLENDPFEFHNLAGDPSAQNILEELKGELEEWQERTLDPFRYDENLRRFRTELDSCFVTGKYEKKDRWYYPEYFSGITSN